MSAQMSREELLSRFPALRGDIHASDPLVDQIELLLRLTERFTRQSASEGSTN